MPKRLTSFALVFLLMFNSIAFANTGMTQQSWVDELANFAQLLSSGDTQTLLRGVAAATGDPRLIIAVEIFSFLSKWLGGTNSLSVNQIVAAREVRGPEAYEILKTWGLANQGVTPQNAVVVIVETKDGLRAAYTQEELQRAGWRFNPSTGMWEPGPNAKDLPARVSLRIKATPRGQTEVLAGMDFPITVFWEVEALKPDATVADKISGSSQVNIPGSVHRVPKCDNVFEGAIVLPNGIGNVGFRYVYHTYSAVASVGEGEERTSNCDRIIEQATTISLYSNNVLTSQFVAGGVGEPGGLLRERRNDSFELMNALEERRSERNANTTNPLRSGLPGLGSSFGGAGGFGSSPLSSPSTLRSAINEMGKYQFADLNDQKDFQDYLREETHMLNNATTEVEYTRIGLRLMSVDEMIRNNNYTPGRLGEAIQYALSNITVDSDPIAKLVGDSRMSTEGGDTIRNLIHTFLLQFY